MIRIGWEECVSHELDLTVTELSTVGLIDFLTRIPSIWFVAAVYIICFIKFYYKIEFHQNRNPVTFTKYFQKTQLRGFVSQNVRWNIPLQLIISRLSRQFERYFTENVFLLRI